MILKNLEAVLRAVLKCAETNPAYIPLISEVEPLKSTKTVTETKDKEHQISSRALILYSEFYREVFGMESGVVALENLRDNCKDELDKKKNEHGITEELFAFITYAQHNVLPIFFAFTGLRSKLEHIICVWLACYLKDDVPIPTCLQIVSDSVKQALSSNIINEQEKSKIRYSVKEEALEVNINEQEKLKTRNIQIDNNIEKTLVMLRVEIKKIFLNNSIKKNYFQYSGDAYDGDQKIAVKVPET